MNSPAPAPGPPLSPNKELSIKIFGIGSAGLNVLERLVGSGMAGATFVAMTAEAHALTTSSAHQKLHLETKVLRGLGTGGDPDRGRAMAEEHLEKLKALCEGTDVVLIVAGLGGGSGTGMAPVLARAAKAAGALVLGCIILPFACEGARRQALADQGLAQIRAAADGVICLPNQKICQLIDENTTVLDTFKISNQLLTDGVRSLCQLLTTAGLIEIHFADVCALIRDTHLESAFAAVEAMGATRSREVMDKLLAHPLLDSGRALNEADALLVSLVGGPDLTMAEVNRVMDQLQHQCEHAQIIMGAAIEEAYRERLVLTVVAARKSNGAAETPARNSSGTEAWSQQLLERSATPRPGSRFLPPAPELTLEKMEQLMAQQAAVRPRARKSPAKLKQGQLPLEIISKGRFDKSEPTIHKGEDLDVPTYIRRGVALN